MFFIFRGAYQDQTYSDEGDVYWTNKSVKGELLRHHSDLDLIEKEEVFAPFYFALQFSLLPPKLISKIPKTH